MLKISVTSKMLSILISGDKDQEVSCPRDRLPVETTLCVSHTPPYVYPRIAYPTPPLSVSRTHHAQCVWSPSPCKLYPYAWSSYRLPNTQSMCIHDFTTLHSVCGSLVCVTSQCVCMCVCIDSTVRLLVRRTGLLVY